MHEFVKARVLGEPFEIISLEGAPDGPPPARLWPFIWHFVRQIKALLVVLLVLEACVAAGSSMIPVMIGWLVNDIGASSQTRDVLSHPWLWHIAAPILLAWGACMICMWYIYDHYYTARFNNLIRYQLGAYRSATAWPISAMISPGASPTRWSTAARRCATPCAA